MKKIILALLCTIYLSASVSSSPILYENVTPQNRTNNSIELPSGLIIQSSSGVTCEAGCEDIIIKGNSHLKEIGAAILGAALIYAILKDDCCCTPTTTTLVQAPPSIIVPPVIYPPTTTTVVPEPSYVLLTLLFLIIGALYVRYRDSPRFNHTS